MKHALILLSAAPAFAHETALPTSSSAEAWERFNDWSVADMLYPNLHLHGVGGFSTGEIEELSSGGHDPKRESFSAQAIEPGLSLHTKYLEGYANYLFFQDGAGDWEGELEEAFGRIINMPGGFELRGGRFLSRFGTLNDRHLHDWNFVDSETVNSRFLGEHGLMLEGVELSWKLPLGMNPVFLGNASLGFGDAPARDHSHHHHEHDDGEEIPHEGEQACLTDNAWTARISGCYRLDDFHSFTAGVSNAWGTNGFGRDTSVLGLDVEYLWRENGLEAGGRAFRWRNEYLWRDVDAISRHDEVFTGSYHESGFYSHAIYTWNARLETALRLAWVEGIEDFGQDERFRVSPAVTCWFDEARRVALRTQYNFDAIEGGNEHSLWFQLNIALGSSMEAH